MALYFLGLYGLDRCAHVKLLSRRHGGWSPKPANVRSWKKQHVAGRDMSLLISYKYLLLVQWSGRVCSCGSVVGRQSNNNIWSITSHISIGLYFRSPPPVATCPGDVINTSDQLTDSLVMYIPKGLWSIRFRLRNCSRTTNTDV